MKKFIIIIPALILLLIGISASVNNEDFPEGFQQLSNTFIDIQ
jgi:hypothetical protein